MLGGTTTYIEHNSWWNETRCFSKMKSSISKKINPCEQNGTNPKHCHVTADNKMSDTIWRTAKHTCSSNTSKCNRSHKKNIGVKPTNTKTNNLNQRGSPPQNATPKWWRKTIATTNPPTCSEHSREMQSMCDIPRTTTRSNYLFFVLQTHRMGRLETQETN